MKNLSGKTSEAKQSNLLDKRELVLAAVFFLTALLIFMALSAIAQTSETFNILRYGKEVVLTKDKSVSIVEFTAVADGSTVFLKWKTKNISEKGVYAVMRSEDGINYSYVSLLLAEKGEDSFVVQNDFRKKYAYFQVLYISEQNSFCLSERKNSLDFVKETTTQQL